MSEGIVAMSELDSVPWCLWCLLQREIGTIYAKQLKQWKQAKWKKSPILMGVSRIVLKT
jgi:hypothetical protein